VTKATVRTDLTTGSSRGFGFVVFEKESSQQAALAQKSFHVAHKTVLNSQTFYDFNLLRLSAGLWLSISIVAFKGFEDCCSSTSS